ncbi:PspA/IM30 family protein [Vallitalea pronyensis]|uniref:PspA/IM30 family protein n=1 Tax=Vallitalea pronyensis TaxID=1348613 RepID=A0A8J8MHS7_9FIRM|nr:PspA/IM30 family protein [Vallitalea pronyensis]QUI21691.1 PspA/IM30 family protein [Vallitalea pronyensis]
MGIFNRISTVFKSNVNDLISKAEDPEKMLNQLIIDMSEQYTKAKGAVAKAIADEKRLKKSLDEQAAKAAEWGRKAELAVASGDDNLAIQALNRKKEYDQLVEQYTAQWQGQKQASDNLKASLRDLNNKIDEAKRKKGLLIARAKRAEAQKSIQNTMAGLNDNSVFDSFSRITEKVDTLESEADAQAELNGYIANDDLNSQFEKLENQDGAVMDELAALKAKLGK